tara:strand:- start:207 stop:566 length:360 start_codon:yes stop_codon:yes gene_type:complete
MAKRTKRITGKNESYSISRKLRLNNKSSDEFEIMLNALSVEELIALKLELATKAVKSKMYGIPLWKKMPEIARDAVFKYAVSATQSKTEAAKFLGISQLRFNKLHCRYEIDEYFKETKD